MRKKSFNTTGPCMADMHYMLSPVDRIDAAKMQRFIAEKLYWVLHAPRQTGKTSFLRQIRDGFSGRGRGKFPISIALVGMRDLRDYLVYATSKDPLSTLTFYNMCYESILLQNFDVAEVNALLSQHTTAIGQVFTDDARELLYHYSCGQPWLVNSLAKRCVLDICPNGEDITAAHIERAKEMLIARREVHIDSLAEPA